MSKEKKYVGKDKYVRVDRSTNPNAGGKGDLTSRPIYREKWLGPFHGTSVTRDKNFNWSDGRKVKR